MSVELAIGIPYVWADAEKVHQVLVNLLTNALAATPQHGSVVVQASGRAATVEEVDVARRMAPDMTSMMVTIAVRDTGVGMPAADVQRAFHPFFTTKEVGKGTGLGLFLSRETVAAHGEPVSPKRSRPWDRGYGDIAREDAGAGHNGIEMLMNVATILVVDDDAVARELLAEALKKEGYNVEAFGSGEEAIARGREGSVDLVLTDIRMGAVDGLTVLREFKRTSPDTAVVVLTAFGSLEGAIEAIKQGAYDYLAKPFKKEEIKLVVERSLDHCRLVRENARFREELKGKEDWSPLVGSSPAMLEVYKLVARVSEGKSTVLLQGESGTGKELIARAIHANGPRRENTFVPVNCGALPDALLESEMFGHEKGAFTGAVGTKTGLFESASGGTLFLDEIGELGQALQVKLLRVMQEQEVRRVGGTASIKVDVRIIAATNRDLEQLVKEEVS